MAVVKRKLTEDKITYKGAMVMDFRLKSKQ